MRSPAVSSVVCLSFPVVSQPTSWREYHQNRQTKITGLGSTGTAKQKNMRESLIPSMMNFSFRRVSVAESNSMWSSCRRSSLLQRQRSSSQINCIVIHSNCIWALEWEGRLQLQKEDHTKKTSKTETCKVRGRNVSVLLLTPLIDSSLWRRTDIFPGLL